MRRLAIAALLLLAPAAARADDCDKAVVQTDIDRCMQGRYDAADKALNDAWRALPDASKASLRGEERAWIARRDADCKDETADSEGGSIYPTLYYGCMEKKTRERTGWLKARAHRSRTKK
jgi:uncharacterized protein YecT (DUF1311 family)